MFLNQQETEKVEKTRYLTSNNMSYSSVNIFRSLLFVLMYVLPSLWKLYGFFYEKRTLCSSKNKKYVFKLYGQLSLVKVDEHLMNPPMWFNNYNNFR